MNRYEKFKKMENKTYSEVNRYLKSTTHLTAREWMIARLCADFKNVSDHSEMTWVGENLPDIVPFAESPYSRQEVSNAHSAFKKKVRRSGTTFFYAYYAGLINQEEMLTMIHSMIGHIGELLKIEGGELSESHSEEVQLLIAQVLKNINEADGFEY